MAEQSLFVYDIIKDRPDELLEWCEFGAVLIAFWEPSVESKAFLQILETLVPRFNGKILLARVNVGTFRSITSYFEVLSVPMARLLRDRRCVLDLHFTLDREELQTLLTNVVGPFHKETDGEPRATQADPLVTVSDDLLRTSLGDTTDSGIHATDLQEPVINGSNDAMKLRIFALAKDLGIDSKEMVVLANEAGVPVKNSALASISPEERDVILEYIASQISKKTSGIGTQNPEHPLGTGDETVHQSSADNATIFEHRCPNCHRLLKAPAKFRGKLVQCRFCNHHATLPTEVVRSEADHTVTQEPPQTEMPQHHPSDAAAPPSQPSFKDSPPLPTEVVRSEDDHTATEEPPRTETPQHHPSDAAAPPSQPSFKDSPPARAKGTVQFFDFDKGFGFIKPTGGGGDVYVRRDDITSVSQSGLAGLYDRQTVAFDIDPAKGSAKNVVSVGRRRLAGKVIEFAGDSGTIALEGNGNVVAVSHRSIESSRRYKWLRVGDIVELELGRDGEAAHVLQLDPRPRMYQFADAGSIHVGRLRHLANIAEDEEWDYQEQPTGDLPILRYYVFQTFERIATQDKLLFNHPDSNVATRACFNTGLVTDLQEDILGVFTRRDIQSGGPWIARWSFENFVVESDPLLTSFSHKDFPLATYFSDISEVYLDPKEKRISLRYEHIIRDNLDRFPADCRTESRARSTLRQAFHDAMGRLSRNYKAAVPQFYHGQVQLLLPLALERPDRIDRALVLHRDDKVVIGKTIYYLDWAYRNARVLAKPDREWLHPVRQVRTSYDDEDNEFLDHTDDNERGSSVDGIEVGKVYDGRVDRVEPYGAFIRVKKSTGLCHISKLAKEFVKKVEDVVSIGQRVRVRIVGIDQEGRIGLSMEGVDQ